MNNNKVKKKTTSNGSNTFPANKHKNHKCKNRERRLVIPFQYNRISRCVYVFSIALRWPNHITISDSIIILYNNQKCKSSLVAQRMQHIQSNLSAVTFSIFCVVRTKSFGWLVLFKPKSKTLFCLMHKHEKFKE